jgi:hypothetical protein
MQTLQNFLKKHEHSFFTPSISKNDYDKTKIKKLHDPLQCGG